MKWRLIDFQKRDAFMNMALDESVSESVSGQRSPPTIRFYGWRPSAISIGRFQSMEEEVDIKKCEETGVDTVRRRTGGGAVYHDTGGEITYSVIAPEHLFPKDINATYRKICGWVIDALQELGLEGEFQPVNDILVNGKKVSGSAQTRRNGVVLQHGTVLWEVNPRRMFSLLRVGREKISDKMISRFEERVTSVKEEGDISWPDLLLALEKSFSDGKEWGRGRFSREELGRAQTLAEERYATREWNFER